MALDTSADGMGVGGMTLITFGELKSDVALQLATRSARPASLLSRLDVHILNLETSVLLRFAQ